MVGPIKWPYNQSFGIAATVNQMEWLCGPLSIRLIPENAVGNDISKCAAIRETASGTLHYIATTTPPQMYNLPLASQIPSGQSYTNIYYKSQDNIVHVSFCISRNDKFQKREVFATLPVGYRPGHTIARCVAADGIDFGNGIVVAEIQIYSNGNIMMYHCNSDVKWLLGEFSFIAEN